MQLSFHLAKCSQIILGESRESGKKLESSIKEAHARLNFKETLAMNLKERERERKEEEEKEQREFRIVPYLFRSYVNSLARFTNKVKHK